MEERRSVTGDSQIPVKLLLLVCLIALIVKAAVVFFNRKKEQHFGTSVAKGGFLQVRYTNETTVGIFLDLSKPLTR